MSSLHYQRVMHACMLQVMQHDENIPLEIQPMRTTAILSDLLREHEGLSACRPAHNQLQHGVCESSCEPLRGVALHVEEHNDDLIQAMRAMARAYKHAAHVSPSHMELQHA